MTDRATPQDPQEPTAPPAPFVPPAGPALSGVQGSAEEAAGLDVWATPDALAAPPETPEERAARLTRRRRAALRWGAAVLVFAAAGAGTAFAVTAPERTDIPGLRTASDGRYTFPALVLPPLPSGQGAPGSKENQSRHAADLRHLLLPVPKEAGGSLAPVVFPAPTPVATASTPAPAASPPAPTASASATASTGPTGKPPTAPADWVKCADAAAEQADPEKFTAKLAENACRAATVREWTASDGTRTQLRLLQFGSSVEAWEVYSELRLTGHLKEQPGLKTATTKDWDTVPRVELVAREAAAAAGAEPTARMAYLSAGDVIGVVVMTNPKGVPAAAFRQVVTLQSDLLS